MEFKKALRKFQFTLNKRIALYERIADFLDNKFPVEETLETIGSRYRKRKDFRAEIISDWRRKLAIGKKFSDAIKDHVPAEERVLIAAGETSAGGLPQGLREAIRLSQSTAEIRNTIISGAVYPVVLLVLTSLMLVMYNKQIAEVFLKMLDIRQWPESGRILYHISGVVVNQWWLLGGILGGVTIALKWALPNWIGPGRSVANHVVPFSIYKDQQSASFLLALSSMMVSGTSLNEALQKIQERGSPWLKHHVGKMLKKLRVAGSDYGKALDTGMLDEETAGDIQDYARLSTFEKAVYGIGENSLKKTVKSIVAKMAVAKFIMLAMVTAILGWIYAASYDLQTEIADRANQTQTSVMKK
jgi:toxin coregulated pilus biosynthesis protein E